MKRSLIALAVLALALPFAARAQRADDCAALRTLQALYEIRQLSMVAHPSSYAVDRAIETHLDRLRDPLPGGGYRWVRLTRPVGDGPVVKREHLVQADHAAGDREQFEADGSVPFAVRIVVPRKRSLTKANKELWVGTVRVRYATEGQTKTLERKIDAWLLPDNSRTIDLGVIADRAEVEVETATKSGNRGQSLVEVHFRQAVAQDDPANPNFEGVEALKRLQYSADAATIDLEIARLERQLFPGIEITPFTTIVTRLREAEALLRSEKEEEKAKGQKALAEVVRSLP
ncbi:MAG TPA: hypothetical protein VGF40_14440 [Thermoanaerobaculia bacterium]